VHLKYTILSPWFIDHIQGSQDSNSPNFLPMEIWLMVHKEMREAFVKKWNNILKVDISYPAIIFPKSKPRIFSPTIIYYFITDTACRYLATTTLLHYSNSNVQEPVVRLYWKIDERFDQEKGFYTITSMSFMARFGDKECHKVMLPIGPLEKGVQGFSTW
jgi:hypothetical protein